MKFYLKRVYKSFRDFVVSKYRAFNKLSRKRKIIYITGFLAAILILIPLLSYLYFVRDIYDRDRLMNRNNTGVLLLDVNNEVFYSSGRTANDRNAKLSEISPVLVEALISSEDKTFYEHSGFSPRGIAGAMVGNIFNRDIKYGGSTITQQLVKNNLLTDKRSFLRKYQELSMSIAIEQHYSKDDILEMYLNSVYFGEKNFGIIQASESYFKKSPSELSLAESSFLIGLLPAPSLYSPFSGDLELAKEQQSRVLNRMLEDEKISEEEKFQAETQALAFAAPEEKIYEDAPHFIQMVMSELNEKYGEERVARSGFKVSTTLNLAWQREAEDIVANQISRINRLGATNASMVAIDPKLGEIRALVGSVDFYNKDFGQVNMALIPRQPGSSFKPIVFAEALDKEIITPATIIRDERKTYGDYTPENFDFRFRGDISVRRALATSLNIPAIEVIDRLGVEEASEAAQRMGISTVNEPEKYGLPLVLGTAETRLLDMTNAYASFANKGEQFKPTTIKEINNKFNKKENLNRPKIKRVQSESASYLISSILKDSEARAATFGSSLNISNREVAVKTGTTNDNKDAWTIGYSPNVAVGVWVGDNQLRPMRVGGSAGAGPIWKSSINRMLNDLPNETFIKPRDVVSVRVCNLHGNYEEFFIKGTAPSGCRAPDNNDEQDRIRREEEEAERIRLQEEQDRIRREEEQNSVELNPPVNNEDTENNDGDSEIEPEVPTEPTNPTAPVVPPQTGNNPPTNPISP